MPDIEQEGGLMPRTTPGNYVPLDVNYARDAAIRRAGPDAELLFVRGLAYAKGSRDGTGRIPRYDLPVVAVGLKGATKRVAALVAEQLWIENADGWTIRSWQTWNGDDDGRAEKARRANCKRWHADRGRIDPACEFCQRKPPQPRSPGDSPKVSPPESPEHSREESPGVIQGKGSEGNSGVTLRGELQKRSEPLLPPERCENHRENPALGPCGACGDARRIRQEADRARAADRSAVQSALAKASATATAQDIARCDLCDATGYVLTASGVGALCAHDPEQAERAIAGVAAARAAIGRKGQS